MNAVNGKDGDELDNYPGFVMQQLDLCGTESIFELTPFVNPVDKNRHPAHVRWTVKRSFSYLSS